MAHFQKFIQFGSGVLPLAFQAALIILQQCVTEQVTGNKCMKLDKTELSWAAARNVCKEAGADLAVVSLIMMMARAFLMMMIMLVIMAVKMVVKQPQ